MMGLFEASFQRFIKKENEKRPICHQKAGTNGTLLITSRNSMVSKKNVPVVPPGNDNRDENGPLENLVNSGKEKTSRLSLVREKEKIVSASSAEKNTDSFPPSRAQVTNGTLSAPGDCDTCPASASWGKEKDFYCFYDPYFLGKSRRQYLPVEEARKNCPRKHEAKRDQWGLE